MMKRFIIGMLILGGIIATAALIMRRRSDVGWDELVDDTSARMSDAAEEGSATAQDVAAQTKEVAEKATDTVVDLSEEAEQSTS